MVGGCAGRVTTNFAGVDVVPLLGAIAGCHCSVLWLWGGVTTNFGGVDVVPLQGAIAGCHRSVLWLGGGIFFTLITQKLVFAIWGLCWYNFYNKHPNISSRSGI